MTIKQTQQDDRLTLTVTRESYKEKLRHLVYTNCHGSVINDAYFQAAMKRLPFYHDTELHELLLDPKTAMTATLAMLQVIEHVRF